MTTGYSGFLFLLFLLFYWFWSLILFSRIYRNSISTYNRLYRSSVKILSFIVLLYVLSWLLWINKEIISNYIIKNIKEPMCYVINPILISYILQRIVYVIFIFHLSLQGGFLFWYLPIIILRKRNFEQARSLFEKQGKEYIEKLQRYNKFLKICTIVATIFILLPLIITITLTLTKK